MRPTRRHNASTYEATALHEPRLPVQPMSPLLLRGGTNKISTLQPAEACIAWQVSVQCHSGAMVDANLLSFWLSEAVRVSPIAMLRREEKPRHPSETDCSSTRKVKSHALVHVWHVQTMQTLHCQIDHIKVGEPRAFGRQAILPISPNSRLYPTLSRRR